LIFNLGIAVTKPLFIHKKEGPSIGFLATSAGDDLTEILDKSRDLDSVQPNDIQGVTSITFTGHSNNAWFGLSDKKNVSSISPQDLAKSLEAKIINPNDKKQLTDFYLLSCEAGLSQPNTPSFAQRFSEEMHKLGFTNLKVHAMTNPATKTAATGMVVEIQGPVGPDALISSWCYQSEWKEKRDGEIKAQISELENSIKEKKLRLKAGKDKIATLKKEQESLRLYVCRSKPYTEVMGQENNTFVNGKVQAQMSEAVVNTLEWLRAYEKKGKKELGWTQDDNRAYLAQQLIKKLEESPHLNADEIIKAFDALVEKEFNRLGKVTNESSIKEVKEGLQGLLTVKPGSDFAAKVPESNLQPDFSGQVTKSFKRFFGFTSRSAPAAKVPASNLELDFSVQVTQAEPAEKDYLNELIARDGFWAKVTTAITGTQQFARNLALQLKMIRCDEVRLNNAQADFFNTIQVQWQHDKEKLYTVYGTLTPVGVFYDTLHKFKNRENEWKEVQEAYRTYTTHVQNNPEHKSTCIENNYKKLEENINNKTQLENQKGEVKKEMIDFIEAYLQRHQAAQDKTHLAKKNVMRVMKAYLENPSKEAWDAIATETHKPGNENWNKGLFSKVESTRNKLEAYHEELMNKGPR
jgi:hypothetical protein